MGCDTIPKNRKLQNIIGTEHITDAAEAAIAAQASGGATVAFKNVAVSGQDNVVADAATDTLTLAGAGGTTITTNAGTDTVTITSSDTQLSTEQVQDIVGAMFTGNTETNITATYEDSDGTIDLVASAGGGQIAHAQHLSVPIFSANSGLVSVHPLLAAGNAGNSVGLNGEWIGTTNTEIHFFPCVMQETGTLATMQYRIGNQAGDTLYLALYASDSDGLPTGSPTFTHTNSSTATNTSYNLTPNVSGITKGDLIYFAAFGQSTRSFLFATDVTDGGTFSVPRGLSAVNYSAGVDYQSFKLSGQTNGVFPTLSASTNYTGHATHSYVARIGITFT